MDLLERWQVVVDLRVCCVCCGRILPKVADECELSIVAFVAASQPTNLATPIMKAIGSRVCPAALHVVQIAVIGIILVASLAPLGAIVLPLVFPFVAAGIFIADDRSLPENWNRWPNNLLIALFIYFPIGILLLMVYAPLILFVQPASHLCLEIWKAIKCLFLLSRVLPDQVSPELDAEAPRDEPASPARKSEALLQRQRSHENQLLNGERYREHKSIWAALEGDAGGQLRPGCVGWPLDLEPCQFVVCSRYLLMHRLSQIFCSVRRRDVRLLSLKWLMGLASRGGVLQRRQDLPEEAFIDVATLRKIERASKHAFQMDEFLAAVGKFAETGFCAGILRVLATLFRRRRNVDHVLPVVAVSYCAQQHPKRLNFDCGR